MKKKPEILQAICQSIADGVTPANAALLENISERAFFLWLRQSKENADPSLIIDWQGERVPFDQAVRAAREIAASGDRPSPSANVVHHYHHFIFEPVADVASPKTPRPEPDATSSETLHTPSAVSEDGSPGMPDAELIEMLRLPDAPSSETPHPEPVTDEADAEVIPDEAEPELIPDKPAPAPVAFDEPPARPPRSALERDLLARLAAARAKNAPGPGKDTGEPEGPPADSAMAPGGVSTD